MRRVSDQILTVAQMRDAEEALIAAGSSVDALMQIAGHGAAEWVWRLGSPKPVTVLCGSGNNGGDGYVIAESLRERGLPVTVVAPLAPGTDAARNARAAYRGEVLASAEGARGHVLVDCLFGSGLVRPLSPELFQVLRQLADSHPLRIAVDLPSGVESDSGRPLNEGLPDYRLTVSL
ncbi:MAG: NAD(P)H-hydrate epimerase, partial [Sphingomonadales bacterium 63-6]